MLNAQNPTEREKQFGDLIVKVGPLGLDILNSDREKICFFGETGAAALANFIKTNTDPVVAISETIDTEIKEPMGELNMDMTRGLRSKIQDIIDIIGNRIKSRESSLAYTKLQEGKMWLGMHMGSLGGEDLNAKRDAELTKK